MGLLRQVALAILAVSAITFIALFGRLPALRGTPVAWLYRLLCVHSPRAIQAVDARITGGILVSNTTRLFNLLLYERHPLVLILFLGLLSTCASVFILSVWHILSALQRWLIVILVPLPYVFTYLCARPQRLTQKITRQNHSSQLVIFPYDHTLYHPNTTCRTCKFVKPARSKHCSLCKICVARHDHHCAWVNNCIGLENYRWFLGLLASLAVLLSYGAYLAFIILAPLRPQPLVRIAKPTIATLVTEHFSRWGLVFSKQLRIGAVGLLALMCSPLPTCLLAYHAYLIWAGMTTNETSKWAGVREDAWDGLAYRGRRVRMNRKKTKGKEDPGATDAQKHPRWPISSQQIVTQFDDGGPESPYMVEEADGGVSEVHDWQRVWSLQEVQNLYDLGFWDNMRRVLFP